MLSAILAFFTAIPGIGKIVTSITSTVYEGRVRLLSARLGVTRDVAITMLQSAVQEQKIGLDRLALIASNKWLTRILVACFVPILLYMFQCVVIDTIICERWLGISVVTPPVKGQVGEWMNTIIVCLFGSSTTLGVGQLALRAIERAKAS